MKWNVKLRLRPAAILPVLFGALLWTSAVTAIELPPLEASYDQVDPAAQRVPRIEADSSAQRDALDQRVRREPRNPLLRLQLAWSYADRGQRTRVPREIAQAERMADEDPMQLRVVHYNAGWIQLHLGDHEAAARHWREAQRLHGGQPDWVPVGFALILWLQGNPDQAYAYYARAAQAQPDRWGGGGFEAALVEFGPNERLALQSLRERWQREGG